jgi:hypothetical protein
MSKMYMLRKNDLAAVGLVAVIAGLVIPSGCAKPPTKEMADAKAAVAAAKATEADVYVPSEYKSAEDMLNQAKDEVLKKEYQIAKDLALKTKGLSDSAKEHAITAKEKAKNEANGILVNLKSAIDDADRAGAKRFYPEDFMRLDNILYEFKSAYQSGKYLYVISRDGTAVAKARKLTDMSKVAAEEEARRKAEEKRRRDEEERRWAEEEAKRKAEEETRRAEKAQIREKILKDTHLVRIRCLLESEWGKVSYAIKENLERELLHKIIGLKIVPEDSQLYDATFYIDYKETKGGEYIGGTFLQRGTNIKCETWLYHEKLDETVFKVSISGSTPYRVEGSLFGGTNIYQAAIRDFENAFEFKHFGELVAIALGNSCDISGLVSELISSEKSKAVHCLERAGWTPKTPTEKAIWAAANGKWEECVSIGQPAVEPLIKLLKTAERSKAAWCLGEIGDKKAVMPLIRMLEGNYYNNDVKIAVVIALGKLKDDFALRHLEELVNGGNESLAKAASEAIKNIRSKK